MTLTAPGAAEILQPHWGWLRSVIMARLGRLDWTEDVLGELSLAVIRQWNIARPERVEPWLHKVAVRQALLFRRQLGRQKRKAEKLAQMQRACSSDESPLTWLLHRERRGLVQQALGRLSSKDREILLLKYAEDWSYQQIATRLETSIEAVESRLHRARHKLRQAIVALGGAEP